MNEEDSKLLEFLAGEYNMRVVGGREADMEELLVLALEHASTLAPQALNRTERLARRLRDEEARSHKQVFRRVGARFGETFRVAESAILMADVLVRYQVDWISKALNEEDAFVLRTIEGVTELVGGVFVKCMLLNSLVANCVLILREVMHLLREGYPAAAASRTRTLYETSVVARVICMYSKHDNNYELTDRYHAHALIDQMRLEKVAKGANTAFTDGIVAASREKWGSDFLRPYGWAIPALSLREGERPTFRSLEDTSGSNDMRFHYVSMSHDVHPAALSTISRANFRRAYPNSSRGEFDSKRTARVLWTSLAILDEVLNITTRDITIEAREWDGYLALAGFHSLIERAIRVLSSMA